MNIQEGNAERTLPSFSFDKFISKLNMLRVVG